MPGAGRCGVAAALVALAIGGATAQPAVQPPAAAPSNATPVALATLVATGFEIKGVSLLSLEAAQRINPQIETEALLVTLQRGPSVAVCFVSTTGWAYMREASVLSAQNCDLRTFTAP